MHLVGAGSGFPGTGGLVEGSQLVGTHLKGKGLALAGLQFTGLAEGLQLAGGFLQAARGSAHIEFHHFLTGHGTGVGDGNGGLETIGHGLYNGLGIGEGGIAEAISEGIGNGHVTGNEVTVAHPDAFLIVGIVHILLRLTGAPATALLTIVIVREVGAGGMVHEVHGEGHGKLAGGVHLAG